MTSFSTEFEQYCEQYGTPEYIELLLCDVNAVFRGKWLPGNMAEKLEGDTVRLPLSTYAPAIMGNGVTATGLGHTDGDPDGVLKIIPGTLHNVSWKKGNIAQVMVEMHKQTGEISSISPRQLLQSVIDRFHDAELFPVVATELEFYIHQPRTDPESPPEPPIGSPDLQNYNMSVLSKYQDILTEIINTAQSQGIPTDTLIAEYGPGQFEINFHHTKDILSAAEAGIQFRHLVRGIVKKHGLEATFMAKPYADYPGNGMHVHASVVDADGKNVFASGTGEVGQTLLNAVSGVLGSMRELQLIFAPHLNSFRRFTPNSFAPVAPNWGIDNRDVAVRLPEVDGPAARLEHRISGADVNPYLVLAAILGGMLHGMQTPQPLPESLDSSAESTQAPLEHDWSNAIETFASSDIAAEIFGEYYRDMYVAIKQDELATIGAIITPAEYKYYLGTL